MLLRFTSVIFFFVLFLYLLSRWFERNNLWMTRKNFVTTPDVVDLAYEDIYFDTKDGVRLNGWFIPASNPKAALLFCHGNGGNISYRTESLRQFHSLDLDVFIFDYRGYGKSTGWLTEEGTYQDATAAYQWLKNRVPGFPILIFGRSLGANIAADLATRVEAAGLIYESGFNSVQILGKELFPFLPVRWLTRYHYNALEKIHRVKMPIFVIHSREDERILFHHSQALFDAAPEPKRFLEISGGHNDGFILSETAYLAAWKKFLADILGE